MPLPRVPDLRHRVDLETSSKTPTGGAAGTSLALTYTSGAQVWARIELVRGGRYQEGQQLDDIVTHRITIRWREDYETWRYVSDGARRWRVANAGDPDGRRTWVEYGVTELTP